MVSQYVVSYNSLYIRAGSWLITAASMKCVAVMQHPPAIFVCI